MTALDRLSGPRSPSEAIARSGSTLYRDDVSPGTTQAGDDRRWGLRARLLGGVADGRAIQLDSLIAEIAVYVVDGGTIACDQALPHHGEGRFVGVYRLVTGGGPEPPVYVAGA
jgi:hypothetical protein